MAIIGPSDRKLDAGEFFGDGPEPTLQFLVVGLRAGLDDRRMTALLEEAVGLANAALGGLAEPT